MAWILARKVEMTRVIKGNKFVPVTILEFPTMKVVGYKTLEKDGYEAMVVGIVDSKNPVTLKKDKTTLSKNEFSTIREFAVAAGDTEKYAVGSDITLDILDGVETVELNSISKGKGFAGAMKRHNFSGGPASHGSKFHRALGSIGNRKPVRTHKGKKMHGHMGVDLITLKNIPVEIVNKDANIIGLRGPVPGARNSLVSIIF